MCFFLFHNPKCALAYEFIFQIVWILTLKFRLLSFFLSFFSFVKCHLFPQLKSRLSLCPRPLLLTRLFPSNPALGVFTGESEVLPLTVELISFPAWPLCGPPGPSVVGPHFCHLWINNSCSPNHFPIDWYFAACLFMHRERRALFVSWFNLMLLFCFFL